MEEKPWPWNQHTRLRNCLPHELKKKESLPSLNSLSLSVYTCLIYPSGFSQRIFGKIKEILLTITCHEVAGTRDQPGDQHEGAVGRGSNCEAQLGTSRQILPAAQL